MRVSGAIDFLYILNFDGFLESVVPLMYKYAEFCRLKYGGRAEEWLGLCAIGTILAARNYDARKSGFETYANYRIRGVVSKAVAESRKQITVSPSEDEDDGFFVDEPVVQHFLLDEIDREVQVDVLLDMLPPEQCDAVAKRFGLRGYRPHTYKELGDQNLPNLNRGLENLRRLCESLGLEDFLD